MDPEDDEEDTVPDNQVLLQSINREKDSFLISVAFASINTKTFDEPLKVYQTTTIHNFNSGIFIDIAKWKGNKHQKQNITLKVKIVFGTIIIALSLVALFFIRSICKYQLTIQKLQQTQVEPLLLNSSAQTHKNIQYDEYNDEDDVDDDRDESHSSVEFSLN
jgi:hypothetical protein